MYLLKATDQGKGKTRYGNGYGNGNDKGNGYGYGNGYGDGYYYGYDHGDGDGYGYSYGDGNGYGYGYDHGKLTFTPEHLLLLLATEVASVPT